MEKLLIRPSQIDSQFIVPTDVFLGTEFIIHYSSLNNNHLPDQFMFEQFLQQKSQSEGQME